MNFIITLISFIIVLGIVVFIHELGHFIFAKKAKIHVYEFAIGMGPKLFQFKRKNDETIYSLRLLPIGGYVSMAGEEVEDDKDIPKEKKMQNKTWLQKLSVMIAGITFNFILAIIIFFILALINGSPDTKAVIGGIEKDYPISKSTLKKGDTITYINKTKINSQDRLLLELQILNGKEITFTVIDKDGKTKKETIKPKEIEEETDKGKVKIYRYGFNIEQKINKGFLNSLKYAFTKFYLLIEQMVLIIFNLIIGRLSLKSMAGPVGIFNIVGQAASSGLTNIVYLIAYLSVNIGFINLIPLPAFDGGRILFLIIEKVKGSPVNPKTENIIHAVGFILLMFLMILITLNDIINLF